MIAMKAMSRWQHLHCPFLVSLITHVLCLQIALNAGQCRPVKTARNNTTREKKLLWLRAFQFIVNFIICTRVQINACAFVTFTASDVTSNRIKIEKFKKIYTTSDTGQLIQIALA